MILSTKHLTLSLALCALAAASSASLTIAAPATTAQPAEHRASPARPVSGAEMRARYARHFGLDGAADLHEGKLAQEGVYVLFSEGPDGVETSRSETLPKGEPMLFDASGTPVMIVDGGEPVVAEGPAFSTAPLQETPAPSATAGAPTTTNTVSVATGAGSSAWLAALPPLMGLGGVVAAQHGSTTVHGANNPVPEPASFMAVGLGVLALAQRTRRRA